MSAFTDEEIDEIRLIAQQEIAKAHGEEAGEELREAQQDQLDLAGADNA